MKALIMTIISLLHLGVMVSFGQTQTQDEKDLITLKAETNTLWRKYKMFKFTDAVEQEKDFLDAQKSDATITKDIYIQDLKNKYNNVKKQANILASKIASDNYDKNLEESGYVNNTKIDFFGAGNISSAYNGSADSKIPASTGIGVHFDKILDANTSVIRRVELMAIINVASTLDTIKGVIPKNQNFVSNVNDYGNFLLLPTNTGRSASLTGIFYFDPSTRIASHNKIFTFSGIKFNLVGSSRVWNFSIKDKPDSTQSVGAWTLSGRVGLFYDFIPFNIKTQRDFSITIGTDLSFRALLGDIKVSKTTNYENVFLNANGSTFFYGLEPYLSLRLKNIKAEVSLPFLFGGSKIQGLTGGQFVTSITFIGGFPLKLN